ncbi:enoyl-CoA hydratase/isomerase family protein, partial [Escherichia coli]|nr:enoyl-CoA hydratase/isomerase family protein [Escherichia coli]
MTEQVRVISGRAGVARIVLCNPPLNAITGAMRAGIMQALNMVLSNPATRAVLLLAEGRTFPSGAEMSDADARPTLGEVCAALEGAPVPVIAVVHGTALGAGCALTLGAHFRICGAQAAFGFPEVTLGRVPDAGATQRLPRLVGAQAALELMLAGRPVAAPEAARLGLVDQVIEGDPRGAAQDYAEALIAQGQGPRPIAPRIDHLTGGRSF